MMHATFDDVAYTSLCSHSNIARQMSMCTCLSFTPNLVFSKFGRLESNGSGGGMLHPYWRKLGRLKEESDGAGAKVGDYRRSYLFAHPRTLKREAKACSPTQKTLRAARPLFRNPKHTISATV